MSKKAYKIAFGGVAAALSLTLMFLTGVIPFGTYAFPAFAGMSLVLIAIELGYRMAFAAYAIVALMSVFFVPDKEAAMFFILILGYYPILKGIIEGKIKSRLLQYVLKFAVFNACMIAAYYLGKFILQIPDESFVIFGVFVPYVFLLLGNIFFILYDICITVVVSQYLNRFRQKIFKNR